MSFGPAEERSFFQSLQTLNKWQNGKRSFCVGDVVLLRQNEVGRNQWPMTKVTKVFKGSGRKFEVSS